MRSDLVVSPRRRIALTLLVMAASLMQVLDSTIANVALPHIQAALGAAPDTISWVLTSYIIGAAVATPLTGWLEARFGRFNLTVTSVLGFTVASMLCGASTSLPMIVAARLVQGLFGAFISPLSQAIMIDIYPDEQRSKALTIWGIGVMVGPVLGPVIGGVLTDSYNWRWIFFVNLPIGLITVAGLFLLLPRIRIEAHRFDMMGYGMLAVALVSLQLTLDRGSQLDWFSSTEIIIEAGIAFGMFWMFLVHMFTVHDPIIPLRLFRDRNFLIANIFTLFTLGIMMSGSALLPQMLQTLFGYDTTGAGMLMAPRGFAMMIGMVLVGRLASRVDTRLVIVTGMLLIGLSQWIMIGFNLQIDSRPIIVSGMLNGLGLGLTLIPINLIAYSTLAPDLRTSAAAMFALSRNIGGSIAIAIFAALLAHNLQVSHSDLAGELSNVRVAVGSIALQYGLGGQAAFLAANAEINRQALMIAYIDDFWLMMVLTFALVPLCWFLNISGKVKMDPAAMPME